MKLRDAAAGALAAWQAMTMTGPGGQLQGPPSDPPPQAQERLDAWRAMTMTPPSQTPGALEDVPGPTGRIGAFGWPEPSSNGPGGFGWPVPGKGGQGGWNSPATGPYQPPPAPATPLLDAPDRAPAVPPATGVPSTTALTPPAPTDEQALAITGYDPSLSPQVPPPRPGDDRGLTVDETRFVQGDPLLSAAYLQGQAVAPRLGEAGYVQPASDRDAKPGIRLDRGGIEYVETFDDGVGRFTRQWGPGVDTGVPGQLTVHRAVIDGQETDSGIMVPPTGADAGFGYGLYTFDLQTSGGIGTYALTWPGTDRWPGPEYDVLEIQRDGTPYATVHSKGEDGGNTSQSIGMPGVDPKARNTYQWLWAPTGQDGAPALTLYVNGQEIGTVTQNVGRDRLDGGENAAPGIGAQTWWSADAQAPCSGVCPDTWITLYGFSYQSWR